jgi:hypothetical protein
LYETIEKNLLFFNQTVIKMAIYIMNKKLLNVSSEIYAFESSVPALQNNITALRSNCGMYIHGLTT